MISASQIAGGGVTDAAFNNIAGLSSNVQTQLNAQGGAGSWWVTGIGGTGDAITGTISPARVLAAGDEIRFKAGAANTGAATIALTGATPATAVALQKNGGALAADDIDANGIIIAVYDGSVWGLANK